MTRQIKILSLDNEASTNFKPRQIPYELDDLPKMVIKFEDLNSCQGCKIDDQLMSNDADYKEFLDKYKSLNLSNFEVGLDEVLNSASTLTNCISCRSSIERLFKQLIPQKRGSYSLALDPIQISHLGLISIKQSHLKPDSVYNLFYMTKFNQDMLVSSRNKSSKRCQLHLTENQNKLRQNRIDDWVNVWDSMESDDCRQKLTIIDTNQLLETINKYLKRNKFCSDCKFKVLVAFKILTNEAELLDNDGTYKPELFDGIKHCSESNPKISHLHIKPDKEFVRTLIQKAEAEIKELRPERHAKTIDVAQEEILISIGLFLYERFFQMGQLMKIKEQSWKYLYYSSLLSLKKKFLYESEKDKNFDSLIAEFESSENNKKQNKSSSSSCSNKTKPKSKTSHTCQTNKKSTKIDLVNSKPCIDSNCSDNNNININNNNTNNGQNKNTIVKKKLDNLIKNEDCSCDDVNEFVHGVEEFKKCEMSCCFDIIEYWNKLVKEEEQEECDKRVEEEWSLILNKKNKKLNSKHLIENDLITDEEKQDYYKNKSFYLSKRLNRRELLENKFKALKLSSSLILRPRSTNGLN